MTPELLRRSLIYRAEEAFISLMTQLDCLFDHTSFYLDRYPMDTISATFKSRELNKTIKNLATLSSQLAEVIKRWKHGEDRLLTKLGTEIAVLNEIYANMMALIYFLTSHEIDLEPFNHDRFRYAFTVLVAANRKL